MPWHYRLFTAARWFIETVPLVFVATLAMVFVGAFLGVLSTIFGVWFAYEVTGRLGGPMALVLSFGVGALFVGSGVLLLQLGVTRKERT